MFSLYIHDNKIHGIHDFVNQIQSRHDFIHGVVGGLSSANHHRALTYRMLFKPSIKLVNHEGYSLIHKIVQVRFGARHLYRHTNLKKKPNHVSYRVTKTKRDFSNNYLPITGDRVFDGNGGSHWSGGHVVVLSPDSTIDPYLGDGENL